MRGRAAFVQVLAVALAASTVMLAAWFVERPPESLRFAAFARDEFAINFVDATPGEAQRASLASYAARAPLLRHLNELGAPVARLQAAFGKQAHVYAADSKFGGRLISGKRAVANTGWVYFTGDYLQARGLSVTQGRDFTVAEAQAGGRVGLLGFKLAARLFPQGGALGATIRWDRGFKLVAKGSTPQHLTFLPDDLRVIGVLGPSRALEEDVDPDNAVLVPGAAMPAFGDDWGSRVSFLFVSVEPGAATPGLIARLEGPARAEFPRLFVSIAPLAPLSATQAARDQVRSRQVAGWLLVAVLLVAALAAAQAQAHLWLVRQRGLLGLDRALGLGARAAAWGRARQALACALAGAAVAGAVLAVGVNGWHETLGLDATPGFGVYAVGAGVALALALAFTLPFWTTGRASPLALLRARGPASRSRARVFWLAGLALTAAGMVVAAAWTAQVGIREAAATLDARFAGVLELSTGHAQVDLRSESAVTSVAVPVAVYGPEDAAVVRAMPGVRGAALAEPVASRPVMAGARQFKRHNAIIAGPRALDLLGIRVTRGSVGACVASTSLAAALHLQVGDTLLLPGAGSKASVPCRVSGLFPAHSPLSVWLVPQLPELIVPPALSAGVAVASTGTRASLEHASRLLIFAQPGRVAQVQGELSRWNSGRGRPGSAGAVLPFSPQAGPLLDGLSRQARLFLALGVVALLQALVSLVAASASFIRADYGHLALDRALGASRARLLGVYARPVLATTLTALVLATLGGLLLRLPMLAAVTAGLAGATGAELRSAASTASLASLAGLLFVAGLAAVALAVLPATRTPPWKMLSDA